MRVSSRVQAALAGVAGTAALLAGALSVTATPASASAYQCSGGSCTGKGSVAEGCNKGAFTIGKALTYDDYSVNPAGRYVEIDLRYSPGCRAMWAMAVASSAIGKSDIANQEFWVYNRGTRREEVSRLSFPYRRTLMIGTAGTSAHACLYITESTGALYKMCTGYYHG